MDKAFTVSGNLVDIDNRLISFAEIKISEKRIVSISILGPEKPGAPYLVPGFVDAHIHIESSMLIPSEFARLAVVHGTVATVSDPHEIANVCGIEGVNFMIDNGRKVPFKFNFGAPSCVPATSFETAGAHLDVSAVEELLSRPEIRYLSEMMNFPGVLYGDSEVMAKIAAAKKRGKPVDGHAPGLRGADAARYIAAGISTDHECFTAEEALGKLQHGMKIIIREGSAAKNFEALAPLIHEHYRHMMFCSDDKHPDSLVEGHINQLCARAVAKGIDVYKVLQVACINPVHHYKLEVGLLKENDPADLLIVKDLVHFEVLETYIDGKPVAKNGETLIQKISQEEDPVNQFDCKEKSTADFEALKASINRHLSDPSIPVIEALDGQLITNKIYLSPGISAPDPEKDILKIAVVNRYKEAPVAIAFIKNFGLKEGAIASSVAHDSHNIVVVGADDTSICRAVNLVIREKGGVSAVSKEREMIVPLPVAGLMSLNDGYKVARDYSSIDAMAKQMGSQLSAPFMTLSFMALLVIPKLKLSDLGLFDGEQFCLIS